MGWRKCGTPGRDSVIWWRRFWPSVCFFFFSQRVLVPVTRGTPSCYQQLGGPMLPGPSLQTVSAAESTNEKRREMDWEDLKKKDLK